LGKAQPGSDETDQTAQQGIQAGF